MILFSVMFSMFLFSASSLFVHTLLYMSSLSISPPPSLRLCLPPRGRRTPKFADATELMYLCQCFIIESTLKSPLSGFKPDNIRLAHNPSC